MKKIITTDKAPAPLGPYNQAVLVGNTLYISGQIAIDPMSNKLILNDIESETLQVMQNLKAVLNAADYSFEDVVKSSIFISNMDDFSSINQVYGSFFDNATAPARETVQVAKLPKNVNVEISMIAVK
ncbi:2-iminobutanoate/2-iminopropanoate deaminase [Hyunsoonleella jejuensis]|uniref:2-iminobutanoate/2-iminopropanoate deaminase n=1 Tax=Hyunsoonleella jejuensis TaxID=419940 RepID=A0A1H9F7U1_9FLAO|nr:Rid family detoxifying hydrolase [Hyunsoonleella jejuensis]SEQ33991.1 2-iminobutanoate/2-iminopropanoate deaminase [Hyunsoonleella jejuensis]